MTIEKKKHDARARALEALEEFDRFCRFIDGLNMAGHFVENDFMSKAVQKKVRAALTPNTDAEVMEAVETAQTLIGYWHPATSREINVSTLKILVQAALQSRQGVPCESVKQTYALCEYAVKLQNEIKELKTAQGWQTIESAPRDGNFFIAFAYGDVPFVCAYVVDGWHRMDGRGAIRFPPTHWQPIIIRPLPSPPTIIQEGGK